MKKLLLLVSTLFHVATCTIKVPDEKSCRAILATYLLDHLHASKARLHLIHLMARDFSEKVFDDNVLQEKIINILTEFNGAVSTHQIVSNCVKDVVDLAKFMIADFKNWPSGLTYELDGTPLYYEEGYSPSLQESLQQAAERLIVCDDN